MGSNNRIGWNKSKPKNQPKAKMGGAKVPTMWKVIAAGAAVCVGAAVAYFALTNGGSSSGESGEPKGKKPIPAAPPRKGGSPGASNPTNAVATPSAAKPPKVKIITYTTNENYEVMKYIDGKKAWMFPHQISPYGKKSIEKNPARWDIGSRVFRDRASREIAAFAIAGPGDEIGPWLDFTGFTERFLESLKENPIVITKDDTEEERQLKEDVIELRKYLKEQYDKGVDLGKLLESERAAGKELNNYRKELEKQIDRAIREHPEYTERDIDDLVSAANQMLDQKGAGSFTNQDVLKRKFRRIQKHRK